LRTNSSTTASEKIAWGHGSRIIVCVLCIACALLRAQSTTNYLITTVAGNGTQGSTGDGGLATAAMLHTPTAVAVDTSGNIYIADANNNVVRKVAVNGIITTVAGNGTAGYSGDNGPATSASLNIASLNNMALDANGNLYVAEFFNNRVRKITPGGPIVTIAGNGTKGFSGDGGPATSASLYAPTAVTIDGLGNLYIADSDNFRVRKIDTKGTITTVAGNGTQGSAGDGGLATSAEMWPQSVAVDGVGNLYILDVAASNAFRGALRKVTSGGSITTLYQWPSVQNTFGGGPGSLAIDSSGSLFVADWVLNLIEKISPSGSIATVAGNAKSGFSGDGGPATAASLNSPTGVTVSAIGEAFFSDGQRVRELVPVPNGCTYSLDQNSQSFEPSGGNGAIKILTSSANCGWLASSSAAWITITSAISGTGNSVVTYSVAPNTNTASRTGSLAIAGYNYAVSQAGVTTIQPAGIVPVDSTTSVIQPGEWVSIYGTNLASSTANWMGDFPTLLGGTSVTIDGKSAYLSFVSPAQINLQAPDDVTTGPVPVVVTTANASATSTVVLSQFAPSFLLLDSKHVAGIIPRSDGSGSYNGGAYDILGPTGNSLGYPTIAAKAGDSVELYVVGLGPTNPVVPAGQVVSSPAPTTNPVSIAIGNANVPPSFAGLVEAGLYQINVTIPAGVGPGDLPLVASVGGVQTQSGVVISLATQAGGLGGNWTFVARSTLFGFQSGASGLLTQNGNTISGQLSLTGTPCASSAIVTGTITGTSISMALNENGQTVIFTGTLSADGDSASGTYVAPPGGCTNGDYGTWSGTKN
jgi:uncharacterized protein (TIGR03437 family)